jgi:hypothetical protein
MTRNRVKATTTCFLKHNLRKVKNAFAPTRIIEQSQFGKSAVADPTVMVDFTDSSTFTHENWITFKKNQQLAWLKTYPILIAQRLAGHEISLFIRLYDLC